MVSLNLYGIAFVIKLINQWCSICNKKQIISYIILCSEEYFEKEQVIEKMIYENEVTPKNIPQITVSKKGCEESIANVPFPTPFHIGLHYAAPARGTWTIAHSPMLIPELHEIYVCCACCLHGVVLSSEEIPNGGADRFSMVTVSNENIIHGDLEDMMIDGVAEIINGMEKKPKCVECFTSCIQHFLNIDVKLVYRKLNEMFPDIDFIDGYMIPTLQRKFTPDVLGRRQLTRAIQELPKKDKTVNIMGNYYPVDPDSELWDVFKKGGYTVQDFCSCKKYEDYKALGEAQANLYFLTAARNAVKDLERRIGQEPVYIPYTYSYKKLRENYALLSSKFDIPEPDYNDLEMQCEKAMSELKGLIGDTAIAIDYAATPNLLSLTRYLLEHSFNVHVIYADAFLKEEEEDFKWLQENHPRLLVRPTIHYKMRLLPRDESEKLGGMLTIGQKSTYFTGSDHFVNLIENSGLYGYRGILKLSALMEDAYKASKSVPDIIQVKAWGCKA